MVRFKNFFIIVISIASCETNPPTAPFSLKTGEVRIEITVIDDNSASSDRTVLLEDFANVSCIPCVTSNKIIQSVLHSYGSDKVVAVKFPTNFPSPVDPFYLAGKQFCDFRISFYNIFSAPTIIVDGVNRPGPLDSNSVKQVINNRRSTQSNFNIKVTKENISGGLNFNIILRVKDRNLISADEIFLKLALVESEIEFANPPGSNGETKFYDVLRVLYPSNEGFEFSALSGNSSYRFENSLDSLWNSSKLEAVVFLQNPITKEIYQTGSTL